MPAFRRRPLLHARTRRTVPGASVLRLVRRVPVRVALAAVILSVLFLPGATVTLGKGAVSRVATRVNTTPTPSGADLAYPLNHTFDADGRVAGAPPANYNVEAASSTTGTPPQNYDFTTAGGNVGAPPQNNDFETGNFTGWTTTGSPIIQTDTPHGKYAQFGGGASLTTGAFTVDAAAQTFTFEAGYFASTNYLRVYVLTGTNYSTQTLLDTFTCYSCNLWRTETLGAISYRGQSVKLKFEQYYYGSFGIDAVRMATSLAGWEFANPNDVQRLTEADGNAYAKITNGSLTSSAFTIDSTAQFITMRIRGMTSNSDAYHLYVLSGTGFGTSTQVAYLKVVGDTWETTQVNVGAWQGQQVKVQVSLAAYTIAVDDIGVQRVEVPQWSVTGTTTPAANQTAGANASVVAGGPTGSYVRTNGTLTTPAFTLASDVQQLSVAYKGEGSLPTFVLELLRGAGFSQVVSLTGDIFADTAQWKTAKVGVQPYAGETVKLRIRGTRDWILIDNAGVGEVTVPGWTLTHSDGVATGEDANGTYVTPSVGDVWLRSADMTLGVVDRPGYTDRRYYMVAYDIGARTNNTLDVYWRNASTGYEWPVFSTAASTPTGYQTRYFAVVDSMGLLGNFVVKLLNGGKVYSLADNVARQQLAEPYSQKVGLAVDTSTGAFAYESRDLAVDGPMPLVLARYYHGHSDRYGTLGYRWSHSFDTRLYLTPTNDAGVVYGSGREVFFDSTGSTSFAPADARVQDTLVKNPDGTYTYTTKSRLVYRFTAAGVLTSVTDPNGNPITLTYDTNGRLVSATGPGSRSFTFAYNANGRLASVTDPTTAVVSYTYDAAGDLVSATDPVNGTQTYTYNKHRLTQVVDKNNQVLFTNTLDSVDRVTQQTDAQGKTITIAYDAPGKGATRVTDPNGNAATYYFDTLHRTTDKTDPQAQTVSYVYDGSGNLQKIVDPALNQWQFAYDASGNVTSTTDPLNQGLQVTYNVQHLPTSVRDARGNVTTLTYDSQGNVISRRDPLNNTTTYSYDSRGNVLTETNPLNQTTTYVYDSANNRTSRTDALGHTWTWAYDAAGRVLTATDPLGNVTRNLYDLAGRLLATRNPLDQQTTWVYAPTGHLLAKVDALNNQTTWSYDSRGLVTSMTDPAGKVWTYTYDNNRNLLTATDPNGNVTRYTYDTTNRLLTETDPTGAVTTYTYDTAGRLTSVRDPLGRTTTYTYNSAGKVTRVTAPNGAATTYTYDADGNRLTETDALNRTTTYAFDALSHLTRVTDPAGNITTSTYDAAGRLTGSTNPLNQTTTYTYDAAGRRTGVTNPLSQTTSYTYDNANRLTGVTDPLGRTRTYGYDAASRRTTTTDPANNTTTSTYDAAGRTTRVTRPSGAYAATSYDARGLVTAVSNALNQTATYTYDNAGRQLTITDPRGATTTYGYDAAGRQTTITDALNGTVTFTYDAAGQQTAVRNARGKTTTSTHDTLGNVLTQTDPLGRTTTSTYDSLGRLLRTTDPRGVVVDYGYDTLDRVTSETYPGGSISYSYDALGRRTSMTDPTGTTTSTYDAAGRVLSTATPQGTVSYSYNAAGQRTSMTLPGSRTVSYSYDGQGRMTTLTDWANRQLTFGYNVDGQRTTTTRPGGVTTTNTYDGAGRLTGVTHTGPGGTLKSFTYTLDAAGNRTGVTGNGGTESYTLDALSRITAVTYPNGDTSSYTYDANGNRLSWTRAGTNAGTTNYTYDDADQLLTEGSLTYSYDAAGNVTARGGDSYTWDWANRLTSATVGGTATTYAYDGDDVRVRKTTGSTTVNYLWDRQSGLPLLVDDGTTSSVHAGGLQEEVTGSSARSPLTDALGSVRGAADPTGALVGSADYDVFGVVRGTSTTGSSFGFTGAQTDAETGLVFLRSRYYQPGSGRFLSADTVRPNAPGTQGYHLYAYVANNPTSWVDPSGHEPDTGTITLLLGGTLIVQVPQPIGLRALLQLIFQGCALNPRCAALLFDLAGVAGLVTLALIAVWCLVTDACLEFLSSVRDALTPGKPVVAPPLTAGPVPTPGQLPLPIDWPDVATTPPNGPPGRGPQPPAPCLPGGKPEGNRRLYIGFQNGGPDEGKVTYVGTTRQRLKARQWGHQNSEDYPRDITLVQVGSYSHYLALMLERLLIEALNLDTNPDIDLTNSDTPPIGPDHRCWDELIQLAKKLLPEILKRVLEEMLKRGLVSSPSLYSYTSGRIPPRNLGSITQLAVSTPTLVAA
jgi:RHS repeat-associated protein